MNIKRHTAVAAALAAALGVAASVDGSPAAADPPPDPGACALTGMTTYAFDGGGDGTSWSDPLNWSGDVAPGPDGQDDAYVCLGAFDVDMEAGDLALVQAIDMELFAQLTVPAGAGLFVYGDPETRPSTVRGYLELGGAVGGPGRIDLMPNSLFGTTAFSSDTVLDPAPALAGDPCALFDGLPPAACATGGELVDHSAMNGYGGLRLIGGYDLIIDGALVPGDAGIGLAAGSRLVIRAGHQVNVHGDGDFYVIGKGKPRPALINHGIIRKFRGGGPDRGVTVISTRYGGDGEVWVEEQDEVIITDGSRRPAEVTAGSLLGSGPCRRDSGDCRFTTLSKSGKRQSAVLEAPSSQPESQRALVEVRPRADLRRPGDLGIPYLVHADELEATPLTPARIELRYDGSLLDGRTWADVQVFRQRGAGAPWRRIRSCESDGTPPGTARACVDRNHHADSSRQVPNSGGDAILVVRTTVTSRWVGR
ncbi:hypothetical protein [Nocardioides stalactiti]|uniref:hypothetical protein n=1 Tax=Nocardioides stalactiti TaxID=2755356 RepID=UPI0016040A0E|nr:hypothetical protein [Nocardioides stalactiti]